MLRLRLWVGVPAVLAGVAVGYFTNLVTGDDVTWPVAVGFGVAVVVWVGLTVVMAGREERERRTAARLSRAKVLPPLSAPALSPLEGHTLGSLLSPGYALSPFRARSAERRAFLRWCLNEPSSRVRLLAGESGVGKTRLMVAVGAALPDKWVAGWVAADAAAALLDVVVAASQPTLIVLDDADTRVREAAELVRRVATEGPFDPPVKLVLVVRDSATFERQLREMVPSDMAVSRPSATLRVIGGAGDRRRWFAEAVRAYANALRIQAPPVAELDGRPVGVADEPMVVTQARAALTALDGTEAGAARLRSAPLDVIVDEVVCHERRRWRSIVEDSSLGLPASFTVQACEDAILSLILFVPTTMPDATTALRSCPRFRHHEEDTACNIVGAVCRLYPGDPALPVTPTPDFLLGALLAHANRAAEQGAVDVSDLAAVGSQRPDVIRRLLRATPMFPSILSLVAAALELDADKLVSAAETLILTGPAPRAVERALVEAIQRSDLTDAHAERLLRNIGEQGWRHVRVALHRVQVAHAQTAATTEPGLANADVATALHNLGRSLRDVGEWRAAVAMSRESVSLRRKLAAAEPTVHAADLARALTRLGASLRYVGEWREALAVRQESATLWRELAAAEPTVHAADLATALSCFGISLRDVGERREALAAIRESMGLWQELAAAEPAEHNADLARELSNLGVSLRALGERREALAVCRESVTLWRELAAAEPTAHAADLATDLINLGVTLRDVGEGREALDALRESVALWRELVAAEPAVHRASLANALIYLAVSLRAVGKQPEALKVDRESVARWRELVAAEPAAHAAGLAQALTGLTESLLATGQPEALAVGWESVARWRELVATEPAAHAVSLAQALDSLAASLWAAGKRRKALAMGREPVAWLRELVATEPAAHAADLKAALTNLAAMMCDTGDHIGELKLRAEAVARLARLARRRPDEAADRYRRECRDFAQQCSLHNRDPGFALRAEREAFLSLAGGMDAR